MNILTKAYAEIGIIKELYDYKIISKEEMELAILEIKKKFELEED